MKSIKRLLWLIAMLLSFIILTIEFIVIGVFYWIFTGKIYTPLFVRISELKF